MRTTADHLAALDVPESEWNHIIEENARVHNVPVRMPNGQLLVATVQDDQPDDNALTFLYCFAEMEKCGGGSDVPAAYGLKVHERIR